jgi:hypothetical protein
MGPVGHGVFVFLNEPQGIVAVGIGVVGIVLLWVARPPR